MTYRQDFGLKALSCALYHNVRGYFERFERRRKVRDELESEQSRI